MFSSSSVSLASLSVIPGVTFANWWYHRGTRFSAESLFPGKANHGTRDLMYKSGVESLKNGNRLPAGGLCCVDLTWHYNFSSFWALQSSDGFRICSGDHSNSGRKLHYIPITSFLLFPSIYFLSWWPMLISCCRIGSVMSRTLLGYSILPDKRITTASDLWAIPKQMCSWSASASTPRRVSRTSRLVPLRSGIFFGGIRWFGFGHLGEMVARG